MTYKLIYQNIDTMKAFDITSLSGAITHSTSLNDQPGKIEFNLQRDPSGQLQLVNGGIIRFEVNDKGIFYGYVFRTGGDQEGTYRVIAYDQTRYLKNEDTRIHEDVTASQFFAGICADFNLKHEIITPSTHIAPRERFTGTLYASMDYAIGHTNIAEGKQYFIRDNFGTLEFTEAEKTKTTLIIGDESLLTSYTYEISVDDDTFNTIKVYQENEDLGKQYSWIEFDSENQRRWGKLQKIVKVDDEMNESVIKQICEDYLKHYNRETKSMKLTALGVPELVAGSGFRLQIKDKEIDQDMRVLSATHTYSDDSHTMDIEVYMI